MKKIALISVSDKTDVDIFASKLVSQGYTIISTGGTAKFLISKGIKIVSISDFTGFDEILEGRVKTLHPIIHAGILAKSKKDIDKLNDSKYSLIDIVVVNLYPFEKTISNKKSTFTDAIENIDIGGPTLVRAAAKNYNDVAVVTDPSQYNNLINEIKINKGCTNIDFRKRLSEEAFGLTAYYETLISNYFNNYNNNIFPNKKIVCGNLIETLRYGENPHQKAAIYSSKNKLGILQLNGKKLSYNNYNDIFSALNLSKMLPKNIGTVIIKHTNPCGVSINKNNIDKCVRAILSNEMPD